MVAPITIGLVGINVAIFYCSASETPHETFFFLFQTLLPTSLGYINILTIVSNGQEDFFKQHSDRREGFN